MCVCFITAGPITKLCAWGEEESNNQSNHGRAFCWFSLRPVTNLNLTDEETTDVQAEMAETLTFNVSVPSDGLQGRSNPLHKWLDGGDEGGG